MDKVGVNLIQAYIRPLGLRSLYTIQEYQSPPEAPNPTSKADDAATGTPDNAPNPTTIYQDVNDDDVVFLVTAFVFAVVFNKTKTKEKLVECKPQPQGRSVYFGCTAGRAGNMQILKMGVPVCLGDTINRTGIDTGWSSPLVDGLSYS